MTIFFYKRAYICAQKNPYICVTNKHVVYAVAESRRIRGTELYRQQKTSSSRNDCKYTWEKTGRISCHNFETNGRPYHFVAMTTPMSLQPIFI